MEKLSHEKLDAYSCSIELLASLNQLNQDLPKGYAYINDQLKRAAFSIPLNIAEGVGKRSVNDKKRFFAIARGSALECGAIIDSCKVLNLISEKQFITSKELLVRIVCMLSKLSA